MNRSIANLLDQRATTALPQVKSYHCKIIAIEFPSHSFVVNIAGYGRMVVKADASINFGAQNYPEVFRGNDAKIVRDDSTGHWRAVEYIITNKCVPTTASNVPNVPLPSYSPPMPTFTPLPPTSFPPIDLPGLPPVSLPDWTPTTSLPPALSSVYDLGGGYNGSIASSTTQEDLYFTTVNLFRIIRLTAYCNETDVSINIFATDGTYPNITLYRDTSSYWNVTIKNPSTGATISTFTAATTSNKITRTLTGTSIVNVTPVGTIFHSQIVTGANTVNSIGYGVGGSLY